MRRRFLLLGLLVWAASPAVARAAAKPSRGPWIHVETRPCFGVCPIYALTVTADGQVNFDGQHFVIHKGKQRRSLSPAEIVKLQRAIVRSGFTSLPTDCCNCQGRTDHPWTVITVTTDGVPRTIEHYHGCAETSRTIPVLEDQLVSLTGAIKWIGTDAQRGRRKWSRSELDR